MAYMWLASSYLERILDVPCPNLPRSYSVPTPYLLLTFRLTISPCYLLAIGLFETYYPRSLKFFLGFFCIMILCFTCYRLITYAELVYYK